MHFCLRRATMWTFKATIYRWNLFSNFAQNLSFHDCFKNCNLPSHRDFVHSSRLKITLTIFKEWPISSYFRCDNEIAISNYDASFFDNFLKYCTIQANTLKPSSANWIIANWWIVETSLVNLFLYFWGVCSVGFYKHATRVFPFCCFKGSTKFWEFTFQTPLMKAVYISKPDLRLHVVRLLLSKKCKVNVQDQWGQTALMIAAFEKDRLVFSLRTCFPFCACMKNTKIKIFVRFSNLKESF